jgi:hypothetical protein
MGVPMKPVDKFQLKEYSEDFPPLLRKRFERCQNKDCVALYCLSFTKRVAYMVVKTKSGFFAVSRRMFRSSYSTRNYVLYDIDILSVLKAYDTSNWYLIFEDPALMKELYAWRVLHSI